MMSSLINELMPCEGLQVKRSQGIRNIAPHPYYRMLVCEVP
jgi:hypothetical protein